MDLEGRKVAKMHLFVEWDEEGEEAGWADIVEIPLERFQFDDRYAQFVSDYIGRGLAYLAEEVSLITQQFASKERTDACE